MKYIIMHEGISAHDAIGNDMEGMFHVLDREHECYVYAVNRDSDSVRYTDRESLEKAVQEPDNVLIYQHSICWEEGYEILKKAACKIIIRYHNITPESFFLNINDTLYSRCKTGREMTERMTQEFPNAFWLCDSRFNASEVRAPEDRIGICPPFHKIESWSAIRPNEALLRELAESNRVNVLFVGRIAPNKGHLRALGIIRQYCLTYDKEIVIRFVGRFDDSLRLYHHAIRDLMLSYDLSDNVRFVGEASDRDLLSYYLGSDLMLCCSEHEGFCVPVIEAQHLGLPVVAVSSAALPETMGKNQLCVDWNNRQLVAAIRMLSRNPEYAAFLRKAGMENYNARFLDSSIRETFLRELERGTRLS